MQKTKKATVAEVDQVDRPIDSWMQWTGPPTLHILVGKRTCEHAPMWIVPTAVWKRG